MNAIPRLFADLTVRLEDLHAVAIEGQRSDNTTDMQKALVSHLRSCVAALNGELRDLLAVIDRTGR